MREEPFDARLCSALLAVVWASATIVLAWHAAADVAGGDSGEIGGAAFALGVAHPTGFPLDMLLLRAFALIPLGSIAWRENLGVACIAGCAVACLALLSCRIAERLGVGAAKGGAVGALLTACALLGFQTFLASALGVEVYSTALLLVSCAALAALSAKRSRARLLYPLFGLALGAHVTAGLLILPLLAADAISGRRAAASKRDWLVRAGSFAACALLVAYLPLASRRDSAFDWGDPETLTGLFRHLTAARIRDAYSADMFANQGAPGLALFAQLTEHAWLYVPALLGLFALFRARRGLALTLLALLSFDLAYAVWINPMGIADRQLGHTSGAVLALLAGIGAAWLAERAWTTRAPLGYAAVAVALTGCTLLLAGAAWPARADGYAVAERYASGSQLLNLAPRAVYLCTSDSACASALFAIYVEGARPDCAVAPAQHLWDDTVRRRLTGLTLSHTGPQLTAAAHRQLAERTLQEVLRSSESRPVYVEVSPPSAAPLGMRSERAPWIEISSPQRGAACCDDSAASQLADQQRARFGAAGPVTSLARTLWSSAYAELGKVALTKGAAQVALSDLRRAEQLTPERAVAHSNLGVALETSGDFAAALQETRRAVELDPARPTPWVNLARLMLRMNGHAAALSVLDAADGGGVHDARLSALREALSKPQGSTTK
jgi:tetratricopeptide (TPR) repeat protein